MPSSCDERCLKASGSSCDCECGGANHGGFTKAVDYSNRSPVSGLTDSALQKEKKQLQNRFFKMETFSQKNPLDAGELAEVHKEMNGVEGRLSKIQAEQDKRSGRDKLKVSGSSVGEQEKRLYSDVERLTREVEEKPVAAMVTEATVVLAWKPKHKNESGWSTSLQLPRSALPDYSKHSDDEGAAKVTFSDRERIAKNLKNVFPNVVLWKPGDDHRTVSNEFHSKYTQVRG